MNRNVILAIGLLLAFGAVVTLFLVLMPGPHKPTDYLVIGAIATFLCLLLLFFLMMNTMQKPDEYKRRKPN
jgi:uncharacterized BrkB/YihY/UPF0761 family membrane protein